MPQLSQVYPQFPAKIDSTICATFDSCKQKFFNEYCLHIAPTGISPDLHAGGAFARGMEVMRREIYLNGKSVSEAIGPTFHEFSRFWGDYEPPFKHPKDFCNTFNALIEYFREYPPESDSLQPYYMADGSPAIEFTFAFPIGIDHPTTGEPLLYCGRFDMLGYDAGVPCVIDEKTTKYFSSTWPNQWDMRGQFMGYVYAARTHGIECNHALIRGIAIQLTQYKFLQARVEYPTWQLNRWLDQTRLKIEEMVYYWKKMEREGIAPERWHNAFPYSYAEACTSYGNCPFMGLCTSKEPWKYYEDFDERIWDPLDKDPTSKSKSSLDSMEPISLEEAMKG